MQPSTTASSSYTHNQPYNTQSNQPYVQTYNPAQTGGYQSAAVPTSMGGNIGAVSQPMHMGQRQPPIPSSTNPTSIPRSMPSSMARTMPGSTGQPMGQPGQPTGQPMGQPGQPMGQPTGQPSKLPGQRGEFYSFLETDQNLFTYSLTLCLLSL